MINKKESNMSSFSRKMKRKEVIQTAQQERKKIKTVTNAIQNGKVAKRIVQLNRDRIREYSQCRVLPALTFAMKRVFGWGAVRLIELSNKVVTFIRDYITAGVQAGKTFITDKWLRDGLADECNFVFPLYKRIKEPVNNQDVGSWTAMAASNESIFILECLETICMWVLHTDYGFGGVRLKRLADEMRRIKPLEGPIKIVYHMMDIVEQSRGRAGVVASFSEIRNTLKELDVDKDDFAGGLKMLNCRQAVQLGW
jgi:hypothetical protein